MTIQRAECGVLELRKQKYLIEQNISALSDQVVAYMRQTEELIDSGIYLEDGKQATVTTSITGVKLKVIADKLPEKYQKLGHDLTAIKKDIASGEFDPNLATWKESKSLSIAKPKTK